MPRPLCLRDKSPQKTQNVSQNDPQNRSGRLGNEVTVIEENRQIFFSKQHYEYKLGFVKDKQCVGCVLVTEFFYIVHTNFVHESLKNVLVLFMILSGRGCFRYDHCVFCFK